MVVRPTSGDNSTDSALDLSVYSTDLTQNLSWCTLNDPHGNDYTPIIIKNNLSLPSNPTLPTSLSDFTQFKPMYFNFNKADWTAFSHQILNSFSAPPNNTSPHPQ
ncbi:Uncharacterized protein FWK35_00029179 [Aphis craccivora]|uniref:Uncharacterized protein n=1 Tax=Aphis craccivora TaxID=307492 RepID=A0A6G0Z0S4_APHCR|nr:Uncharacterized protein FWK35_00029179 [Aphis craccivora]